MFITERTPRSPYGDAMPSEALMAEVYNPQALELAGGVQVGYTLLNRHLLGEAAPIVAHGAFRSDVTTPDRAWEGVQLAALGRPVLMLDMPGHGLSTPHNPQQVFDLCIRRTTESQVEPMLEATIELLGADDPLDYFGISHGGHTALKATELDPVDRVGTIFAVDLPAVRERVSLGLQASYILLDGLILRRKHVAQLNETVFGADYERFKAIFEKHGPQRAATFEKNNPGFFLLNLVSCANASPGALKAWEAVMKTKQNTRVATVISQKGHVSNADAVTKFVQSLDEKYWDRCSQLIIPEEDHSIGIVHMMPRAVEWARRVYHDPYFTEQG